MRIFLAGILIMFFVATSFAQENKVYLEDGKIVIQTPEEKKVLDYSAEEKYSAIKSKKWNVKKESGLLAEALSVYKEKQAPVYSQKVWISEKKDGEQSILIEYNSLQEDSRIIFSPDDNYMYYIGLSDSGESTIYGIKLADQEEFVFNASDDFQLIECPGSSNYFVLLKDDEEARVIVYDADGTQDDVLHYTGDLMDLNQLICN